MATIICMDGAIIYNYNRNEAAMPKTPVPDNQNRVLAALRRYNEMAADEPTEWTSLPVHSAAEWLTMGQELDDEARNLDGDKAYFVTSRANDCRARASYLIQRAKYNRVFLGETDDEETKG